MNQQNIKAAFDGLAVGQCFQFALAKKHADMQVANLYSEAFARKQAGTGMFAVLPGFSGVTVRKVA